MAQLPTGWTARPATATTRCQERRALALPVVPRRPLESLGQKRTRRAVPARLAQLAAARR
jgi:hypothetical protein